MQKELCRYPWEQSHSMGAHVKKSSGMEFQVITALLEIGVLQVEEIQLLSHDGAPISPSELPSINPEDFTRPFSGKSTFASCIAALRDEFPFDDTRGIEIRFVDQDTAEA